MLQADLFSLQQLLLTPAIKGNQTVLAKFLRIHRSTVRKFLPDTEGLEHCVLRRGAKYTFMAVTRPTKRKN